MPAHDHCCVPQCSNRQNTSPGLSFHTFPSDPDRRKRWLVAIRPDEGPSFKVTSSTVVCSSHFLVADYASAAPSGLLRRLSLADHDGKDETVDAKSRKRSYHMLKPDAVPSVFSFKQQAATRPTPDERRAAHSLRRPLASSEKGKDVRPPTEVQVLRKEVAESQETAALLREEIALLKEENASLRSPVLS